MSCRHKANWCQVRPWREQTFTWAKRENRKAWGFEVVWERCHCQAIRVSLVNGDYKETGTWREYEN